MRWRASGDAGTLMLDGHEVIEVAAPGAADDFRASWVDGAVQLEAQLPKEGRGPGARVSIKLHIGEARHVWVPVLAPAPGFVMGDHSFRSPAIVAADGKLAVALVPDLDDVTAGYNAGWRTWMDYDHPARTATLCAGDYKVDGHVMYRARELEYAGQAVRLRLHVLASTDPADLANPFGLAARFHWRRWGHAGLVRGGSQRAPVAKYAAYINRWAFSAEGWGDTVWQEFRIGDRECGAPAFIVDVAQHPSVPVEERRWREQRSVWNQAWFSTQRCANGLYRYGRQTSDRELMRRAKLMTAFALAAPQTDGLFPSVYTTAQGPAKWYQLYKDTPGWDQGRWTNSDRRPGDATEQAVHILDAAFTARLLLEWDEIVGGDAEAVAYARRFADRLIALQLPSGAFPGWVEPDGRVVKTLAEGPESAMGATLLFELSARSTDDTKRYQQAAWKAVAYLEKGPIAEARWEDYETYFSCSRWGLQDQMGRPVERNGVYKQNTLSMFWCAEALLAAHRAAGEDDRWLALGRRCLDELALHQQVWNPPFIAAPCHGGWGVMNADGEWNDARQSLFAPLYMDYYLATREPEYFERGVAALRASFAMLYCPENDQVRGQYELKHPMFGPESYGFMMENIAHSGPAPADGSAIGPFTIFTWGNGAALATAAKIRDLYGDVYVRPGAGGTATAFGIDGCEASVKDHRLQVRDPYGRDRLLIRGLGEGPITLRLSHGEGALTIPTSP